jgi:hypothetical protein
LLSFVIPFVMFLGMSFEDINILHQTNKLVVKNKLTYSKDGQTSIYRTL